MKLSVFLPTIRIHLLDEFLQFLRNSYSGKLEVVFAGPFRWYPKGYFDGDPQGPCGVDGYTGIWIDHHVDGIDIIFKRTFQSPTCAAQEAALACTGDLILHSVDDTLYLPGALDELVESFLIMENSAPAGSTIVYNAPYCDSPEGYRELQKNKVIHPEKFVHPPHYWTAANAGYGGLPNIDSSWMTTCHFLMRRSAFLEAGGFDCQFQYLNHACHDLLYRMYLNEEVSGFSLNETVSLADWVPGHQGDHGPIHDAQLSHDHPAFIKKWGGSVFSPSVVPELKIDPLNYKNHPAVWERRFNKGGQTTYGELGYA